jgi:hypothetical protein
MNTPVTTEEVQQGLINLNVIYKAAMATLPTGLVEKAQAAQQEGLNEAAQQLADLLQKVVAPTVSTPTSAAEEVEVITPKKK